MLKPTDLTPAAYNPRIFSEEAEGALTKSMETFNDISGITYNENTGNIVGGHHRWENLCNEYGIENLEFKPIKGTDRCLINTSEGAFTGYMLRIVSWDEIKEKAANVTANSGAVEGEFTSELQTVLSDIRKGFDTSGLFEELRLDVMEVKIPEIKEVEDKPPVKKSETMISGGGDKYITVKLELSPELSDRLYNTLDRFKDDSDSVEQSLATIISYIEDSDDEDIGAYKPKRVKRKARKRRS